VLSQVFRKYCGFRLFIWEAEALLSSGFEARRDGGVMTEVNSAIRVINARAGYLRAQTTCQCAN